MRLALSSLDQRVIEAAIGLPDAHEARGDSPR